MDTEPALPDITPYVTAAHRAGRRRRVTYGAVSPLAVFVAVAAIVLVPGLLPDTAAQSGPKPAASVATDPQEAHAAQLTATLRESQSQWFPAGAALKERVQGWPLGTQPRPGAGDGSWELTFVATPTKTVWYKYPDLTSDDRDKIAELERAPFDGVSYDAGALVTHSGHVSELRVSITKAKANEETCPPESVRADPCVESPVPGGGTLVVVNAPGVVDATGAGSAEWKLRDVRLIRPDGTVVRVGGYTENSGPPGIQSDGEYALTIDQLKKIALLPGLVYKYQPK